MTLKQNTFEGGTAGSNITTAGSGGASGDAFTIAANGVDCTKNWSAAQVMHGTLSSLINVGTGAANDAAFGYSGYTATSIAYRFYVRFNGFPSLNSLLAAVFMTGGSVTRLEVTSAGAIRVSNLSSTGLYTSPALSINTWYRIEYVVIPGTTTTNGTIKFAVYAGDSATPLHSYDSGAAINAGTNTVSNVQWGRPGVSAATTAYSYYMDSVAASDGATAFIGPVAAANVSPTANAGADQTNVEPWATVTLTGTDSDSDGTVASRAWTQTAGSPTVTLSGTGATRTFEAPGTIAGTTLTFQYAATDDDAATTTDTMTVTVLPAAERIMIGGSWVPCRMRLL